MGNYRVMAVLMIAGDFHFFADVLELETQSWIRYDGLIANGVGQHVAPPVGAITRDGHTFYPNLVLYVKEDGMAQDRTTLPFLLLFFFSLFSPKGQKLESSIAGWADVVSFALCRDLCQHAMP